MESRIGFGGVPLGFATDAPRESAGSFTIDYAFCPSLSLFLPEFLRNVSKKG